MNRNELHYHSRVQQNTPGKYGYRCRHCSGIAFAFTGEDMPVAGDYLENYEISQRGDFPSVRGNKLGCQRCGHLVSAPGGILDNSCVVDIDLYVAELDRQRRDREQSLTARVRQAPEPQITRASLGCGLTIQERADRDRLAKMPQNQEPQPKSATPATQPRPDRDPDSLAADQLTLEELRFRAHRLGLDTTLDRDRLLPLVQETELASALDAQ